MASVATGGAGSGGDKDLPDISKLSVKDGAEEDKGTFKIFQELRRVQRGHERAFSTAEEFATWVGVMTTEVRALSSNSISGGDWLDYLRGLNIRINLTYTGFNSTIDVSFTEEIDMSRNVSREERRIVRMEQFIAFITRVRDIFNAYQSIEL